MPKKMLGKSLYFTDFPWMPRCARAGVRYRHPYQFGAPMHPALLRLEQILVGMSRRSWGHEDVEMAFRRYGKFMREDYRKIKSEFRIVE